MEFRNLTANVKEAKKHGWYWGPLPKWKAEKILETEPDSSFLIRDSRNEFYLFTLTYKEHGIVNHLKIQHDKENFGFEPLRRVANAADFVEKAIEHSRSGHYLTCSEQDHLNRGRVPFKLLYPCSRFTSGRSLKHLCRFVILEHMRRNLIHKLPLPKPLLDYLKMPDYYFEPSDFRSFAGKGLEKPPPLPPKRRQNQYIQMNYYIHNG